MLTDIDGLNNWLATGQPGTEVVFFDPYENNTNLHRARAGNPNFAKVYDRLLCVERDRRVYLSVDGTGRYVAMLLEPPYGRSEDRTNGEMVS